MTPAQQPLRHSPGLGRSDCVDHAVANGAAGQQVVADLCLGGLFGFAMKVLSRSPNVACLHLFKTKLIDACKTFQSFTVWPSFAQLLRQVPTQLALFDEFIDWPCGASSRSFVFNWRFCVASTPLVPD